MLPACDSVVNEIHLVWGKSVNVLVLSLSAIASPHTKAGCRRVLQGNSDRGADFSPLGPTWRAGRESVKYMKTATLFPATLLAAALAFTPALAIAGQSSDRDAARQDMHNAGQDTKDAARHAGRATKNGTKDAYNDTKNGTKKGWHKTKRGSKKAWNKTKGATKGAYNGAKNGAEDSH